MTTAIIVQARMTSTRLPGKILKPVLGKPLLEYQIERLKRVKSADKIIIATTDNATDEPVIELCERLSVPYFRGSENDVLARYYGAAQKFKSDTVVRITSDCPLIDPDVIDRVIKFYLDNNYSYVSNTLKRTFPRGMDTEVFSFTSLTMAYNNAQTQAEREHVTPYLYNNHDLFSIADITYQNDFSNHRWTVDTPEDFELIKRIIETLYPENPEFTLEDILNLMDKNKDWYLINAHIEQKK